jgi:hypothetical protein
VRLQRHSRVRSSRGHVRVGKSTPPWLQRAAAAAVVVVAAIIVITVIQKVRSGSGDQNRRLKNNRTWLEFAWTASPVDQGAVRQLGERLKSNGIDQVYLEASAWRNDGSLVEGEYAADFAQTLRTAYPSIKILLWLRMSEDQIIQPDMQEAVIALASKSVKEWKLDGVQLNGRAVPNNSESYIQLLRDLRTAIGTQALLSVTVPPDRIPADPDVPASPAAEPGLTWDVNYKQRVGLLQIDEVVVMAHASGLDDAPKYETWVAYQVASYATALAELDQPADIIVALPTYDAAPEHDPNVESVRSSIRGVQMGIKRAGKAGKWVKGVGLYEYKTTDSLEWAIYREDWLGLKPE